MKLSGPFYICQAVEDVCIYNVLKRTTFVLCRHLVLTLQLTHPHAILEGAWDRTVLLRTKPATMNTTCSLDRSQMVWHFIARMTHIHFFLSSWDFHCELLGFFSL